MSFFGFKGSGDVLIDIFDNAGAPAGLQLKGNCKEFKLKGDGEIEEMIGFGRDNYGQVIESDTSPKPHTVSFLFSQLDVELFAAGFSGVASTLTQSSGALAAQVMTMRLGKWVESGKLMISNPVLTNSEATTTYVLGTDYAINPRLGLVLATLGGAITDLQSCKFSCDYAAVNGTKIVGATKANVEARIVIDGKERSTGRNFIFNGKRVRLAASTEISLISDKFVEVSLNGTFITPEGDSSPYDLTFLS